MIFNYIRASTLLQNTEQQLVSVEYDKTYEDKLSREPLIKSA